MGQITKEVFQEQVNGLMNVVAHIWDEKDQLLNELTELKYNVNVFKTKINAAITSDNTSDGEVVDKLTELLNEYL